MAGKTAASRQVSARERARAKAAEYRDRENRLEALAVEYFTAADQVEKVYALRDREVEAAEAKAERAAAEAVAAEDAVVRQMLDAGVPRPEVIDRLGCSSADLRRAAATTTAGAVEESADHAEETAEHAEPATEESFGYTP